MVEVVSYTYISDCAVTMPHGHQSSSYQGILSISTLGPDGPMISRGTYEYTDNDMGFNTISELICMSVKYV